MIPKIQRLYFHARDNSGGSYKPHALRMDSLTYMKLHQDRDFTRMVTDPVDPATANKFMGMKIIVEEFNDGSKKHHLTVEVKQKSEDGRSMYFEYADLKETGGE